MKSRQNVSYRVEEDAVDGADIVVGSRRNENSEADLHECEQRNCDPEADLSGDSGGGAHNGRHDNVNSLLGSHRHPDIGAVVVGIDLQSAVNRETP